MSNVHSDDLDMDEWMSLTDEQREAEAQREMAAYSRWYDSLSHPEQFAHRRGMAISNCRSQRRLMRLPHCPEIIREHAQQSIKAAQIRMLKLRIWRATGAYPGEA